MSEKAPQPRSEEETPRPGESFLSRFNRRKTEARLATVQPTPVAGEETGTHEMLPVPEVESEPVLTDADMPPLDALDADSDYRGFLSPKVSESLRRAALRKLFHGPAFNVIDELDDYAEDFTTFEALGNIITADMRHQLELEARKKAEELKQSLLEDDERTGRLAEQADQEAAEIAEERAPCACVPEDDSVAPVSPAPATATRPRRTS